MKKYIETDGTVSYYNDNNNLHREDGPAVEFANGDKHWCINGKLHREDGPAIELTYGTKYWYINGNLHREDGPAVELANGTTEYWCKHNKINCSTDKEYFKLIKMKAFW